MAYYWWQYFGQGEDQERTVKEVRTLFNLTGIEAAIYINVDKDTAAKFSCHPEIQEALLQMPAVVRDDVGGFCTWNSYTYIVAEDLTGGIETVLQMKGFCRPIALGKPN